MDWAAIYEAQGRYQEKTHSTFDPDKRLTWDDSRRAGWDSCKRIYDIFEK